MSHSTVMHSHFIGTVTDEKMGTFIGLATLALVLGLSASMTDAPKERLPDVHPLAFRSGYVPRDMVEAGKTDAEDGERGPAFNDTQPGGTDAHEGDLIPDDALEQRAQLAAANAPVQGSGMDEVADTLLVPTAALEIIPRRRPEPPDPRFEPAQGLENSFSAELYFDPESGIFRGGADSLAHLQLSRDDVRRYRRVFELQEDGRWQEADAVIAAITDRRLMGHVVFQRLMHPTAYRSSYEELRSWLASYKDHAGADRVYRLAQRRRPVGAAAPDQPRSTQAIRGNLEVRALWTAKKTDAAGERRPKPSGSAYREARQRISGYLEDGSVNGALRLLSSPSVGGRLDPLGYDVLRTNIAARLYYDGNVRTSLSLAASSAQRSGHALPYAYWIAGLSAWRLQRYSAAADHFRTMAQDPLLTPWQTAAAAYWAARAYVKLGRVASARRLSQQAARHFRTFYGLIARRALGQESGFDWSHPPITGQALKTLAANGKGRRAIGLLQVGRFDEAADELKTLHPGNDRDLAEAQIAIAINLRLSDLALTLGNAIARPDGRPYDAALYPLPHWVPRDGFNLDRALIYAFMRQESRFDPQARSYRGAAGLMQLMPATAQYVSDEGLDYSGRNARLLFEPSLNMSLGQRYLRYLLRNPAVESNLFMLAAAYNGGPGNLRRWRRDDAISRDPLLFIESIPYRETRQFIEKLLTNFWVYRMRLGQRTPSLDAIAAGQWPVFDAIDERLTQVAQTDD